MHAITFFSLLFFFSTLTNAGTLRRNGTSAIRPSTPPVQSESTAQMVADFEAAYKISGFVPNSNDNITALATALYGFDGCSGDKQQPMITAAYQEAQMMMDIESIKNGAVDFNSAAAVDYLGPPALNRPRQADMNTIFSTFATIREPGWYNPFRYYINARCDQPCKSDWYAFANNNPGGYAIINFCPLFFTLPALNSVINEMKKPQNNVSRYDMANYRDTQAHMFAHELLHIDWASGASLDNNIKSVTDMAIVFNDGSGRQKAGVAYGAEWSKILARYYEKVGDYTIRNADSLTCFITSLYVQSRLDNIYPHKPLIGWQRPLHEPTDGNVLISNATGKLTFDVPDAILANMTAVDSDGCAADQPDKTSCEPPLYISSVAPDSAYPSEYLASRSAWYSSEATTTTTATASASPQNTAPVCSGSPTKWVPRDALNSAIPSFCAEAEKQGVQDKDSGSLQRNYLSGNDAVSLSIEWPSGNPWKPKKDDCIKSLDTIMDSCDATKNPMNWKYGGSINSGAAKYVVVPLKDRGYRAGICAFHLHEREYFQGIDRVGTSRTHSYRLQDSIKDGSGNEVSKVPDDVDFGDGNPFIYNGFYAPLSMTPEAQNGDYIQFSIGSTSWTTKDSEGTGGRCNVGAWDSNLSPVGRDMDCFFPC